MCATSKQIFLTLYLGCLFTPQMQFSCISAMFYLGDEGQHFSLWHSFWMLIPSVRSTADIYRKPHSWPTVLLLFHFTDENVEAQRV